MTKIFAEEKSEPRKKKLTVIENKLIEIETYTKAQRNIHFSKQSSYLKAIWINFKKSDQKKEKKL